MRLSVQIEFDKTLDLQTTKSDAIVGRAPDCDLVVAHDSVSRRHCRIEMEKGGLFYITDLGSSNGTFIDGQRLAPERRKRFLTKSHLTIGKVECELSKNMGPIVGTPVNVGGDATATIRIARIDLNKPVVSIQPTIKPTGPRNPISEHKKNSQKKTKESKTVYIVLFILTSIGVALLTYQGMK